MEQFPKKEKLQQLQGKILLSIAKGEDLEVTKAKAKIPDAFKGGIDTSFGMMSTGAVHWQKDVLDLKT